jgi:hypothetical protein
VISIGRQPASRSKTEEIMDALVLDIAVGILTSLSAALLVWGGWLCLGAASQGRTTVAAERTEPAFS